MIAVTCRNGEHFRLDPDAIERVEHREDTLVVLQDGTRFVLGQSVDDLVRVVRDHHAARLSARRRIAGPVPAPHVPGRPRRTGRVLVPAEPGGAED